jgi:hypothetical protein
MTSQVFDTGTGDTYCRLGPALGRSDVWLVRHVASQELALVQRFTHPSPALVQLLQSRDPELPTIKDSWMEGGAIYVVMDRVSGTGLDELGLHRLTRQGRQQWKRLSLLLQPFGFPVVSSGCLCLGQDGQVRLRCFPDPGLKVQSPSRVEVRSQRSRMGWLNSFFSWFGRPQVA